jgi:hypothetical protein
MTNGTPPPWPDQGGNVVVIDGGVGQDRITFASGDAEDPTAASWFPQFTTGTPPIVTLGGWAGPPPGPPQGTGLVGPGGTTPPPPTVPEPNPGESETDFMERCVTDLENEGVDTATAEGLCEAAWTAAQ